VIRSVLPLLLLGACSAVVTDPSNSGVAISPSPGDHQEPLDLAVVNQTDGVLRCAVVEEDLCPSLTSDDLDALKTLEPGKRWELKDVSCLLADFTCTGEGASNTEPPLRAWSWYIDDFGL
jgi:hypothetical protein